MNCTQLKERLINYEHHILGAENHLLSSVVIPVVEVNSDLHLLFEVRSPFLDSQPGDISFPGGKIDASDQNPQAAAIREVCEELGLSECDMEIITELDLLVAPFGVIIHNFLGKINDISKIRINPDEVSEVFTVPLSFFKDTKPLVFKNKIEYTRNEQFPYHLIANGEKYPFKVGTSTTLFWSYQNKTIWGLTASLVDNLVHILYGPKN